MDALEFSTPKKGRNQNADGDELICTDAAGRTSVQCVATATSPALILSGGTLKMQWEYGECRSPQYDNRRFLNVFASFADYQHAA